jgi:hypothetical protein
MGDIFYSINGEQLIYKDKFELISLLSSLSGVAEVCVLRKTTNSCSLFVAVNNKEVPYHNGIFAQNSIKLTMRKYEKPTIKSDSQVDFWFNNNANKNNINNDNKNKNDINNYNNNNNNNDDNDDDEDDCNKKQNQDEKLNANIQNKDDSIVQMQGSNIQGKIYSKIFVIIQYLYLNQIINIKDILRKKEIFKPFNTK